MSVVKVDLTRVVGPVKPMHGVGQGPIGGVRKQLFDNFSYLKDAGIPYSRLHDVGGAYGRSCFVDVPAIFRDFDADENDPASYDFTFTDALITALVDAGVEPYYRLGVTIENNAEIKAYHVYPPKDFEKWARICEHIVAHYIDGWAEGFTHRITYWEIWNEPDDGMRPSGVSQMWNGTKEQYYRLYETASKHLKSVFGDRIKVGGYGALSLMAIVDPDSVPGREDEIRQRYFGEFFEGFMAHVKNTGSPLDFFSWHCYRSAPWPVVYAKRIRERLDSYGFEKTESHLNEWNPVHELRGTEKHGAQVAAIILGMQKAPLDVLTLYDARLFAGSYAALFDPYTLKPIHAYYVLAAFNVLYGLKTEAYSECDTEGIYAVAAFDGKHGALMISNISGESHSLQIEGVDLSAARWHVIDQPRLLSWSPCVRSLHDNEVVLVEF